ncbi:MAG TPA: hypothetical protein VGM78_00705 [Ilumatobacteraceae bacterium]
MKPAPIPLFELLSQQHGVASVRQLRALGVSLRRQQSLEASGALAIFGPGIVIATGNAPTWHQRAMAATLSVPGSVLTGGAAARLHRLDGFSRHASMEVLAGRGARPSQVSNVTTRRSRVLGAHDRHVIDHIPVTTVPVTLIQLAAGGHEVGQALDSALRDGSHPRWLRDTFVRWRGNGVSGPATLLDLLADRVDRRLPRSWFQRMASEILVSHGIELEDEWPVHDADGRRVAELDLACVDLKVGVECQSWAWHGSPAAQYRDLQRKRTLGDMGWEIVEVWWSDLDRFDGPLRQLRRVIDERRRAICQADRAIRARSV